MRGVQKRGRAGLAAVALVAMTTIGLGVNLNNASADELACGLTAQEQQVWEMFHNESAGLEEIASDLGTTSDAARSILDRAGKKFEDCENGG